LNKIVRKSSIIILGIFICLTFFSTTIADEPTIESITVSPVNPHPQSTISFNAEISGEDISEVYLRVEEANDMFCYQGIHNVSMSKIRGEIFSCNLMLLHEGATWIIYWLVIKCNDTWYNFKDERQYHDLYPVLNIVNPEKGFFHILGKPITKTFFGNTVIFGKTKIIIDVGTYLKTDIEKIELYIDNNLKETINKSPFEWVWKTFSFGSCNIEIKAYVSELNYSNSKFQVIAFIL
jgi:hypothetical protein